MTHTRDDWSGFDNESQEETLYTLVSMAKRLREGGGNMTTYKLDVLSRRHALTHSAHTRAFNLLRDLASGALVAVTPTEASENTAGKGKRGDLWRKHAELTDTLAAVRKDKARLAAERDEAIKERDEARRVNADRHDEIRSMKSALDKATRETVQMVFRERAAIKERDVAIENAKTLVEAAERPGSWGAGKGPTSEAKAEFVDAMAKPAEVKPSCHGCEHRSQFRSASAECGGFRDGKTRVIAMPPGATCPDWCPRLEANQ